MITLGVLTTSYAVKPHAKSIKKNNAELMVANPNAAGTFNDIKKPSFFNRVKMTAAKIIKKVNPAGEDSTLKLILAHLGILWLVAYFLNKDNKSELVSFYLRQTLGLYLFWILIIIPVIGWIWSLFMLVLWIISLIGALQGKQKHVPLFGKLFQKWFSGI